MFLEECKSLVKEKKIPKHIIDGIETFSDCDRKNSDEKISDEENFDEKKSAEENVKKY